MKQICELVNPSDAITFVVDDVKVAGVAILLLGEGAYGLTNGAGDTVVPLGLFGFWRTWIQEQQIDLEKFVPENRLAMAEFLETVCYGSVAEREAFDVAMSRMIPDKAQEHQAWWNGKKRSSLNDIGKGALLLAKALREKAKYLPSQKPIILAIQ
jgi:hypothetical protein